MRLEFNDEIIEDAKRVDLAIAQDYLNKSIRNLTTKSNKINGDSGSNPKNILQAVTKVKLSNGMEVFDFDEKVILEKMEALMVLLDKEIVTNSTEDTAVKSDLTLAYSSKRQ